MRPPPNKLQSTIDNPCVRNCCLDENDICLGCFRTLEEITSWNKMSRHARHHSLQRATARKNKKHKN